MANFVISIVLFIIFTTIVKSQKLLEQRIQSYQRCRYDSDCKPNSFCYGNDDTTSGYCKCKDGYELNRNSTFYECLQAVKLDEACIEDFQCELTAGPLAICNRYKICECNPQIAHNYTDGLCYLSIKLTKPCLTDPNCKLSNGKFGFCTFGFCTCRSGEVPSTDLESCLVAKRLGERCSTDEDCSTVNPNTICDHVCICNMEHVLSHDGKRCLKAASAFGEPCQEDQQCSDYLYRSICSNGNCTCDESYHSSGVRCVKTVKLGQECFERDECVYDKKLEGNVDCLGNICKCIYGQTDKGDCQLVNNSNRIYLKQILYFLILVLLLFNKNFYNQQ